MSLSSCDSDISPFCGAGSSDRSDSSLVIASSSCRQRDQPYSHAGFDYLANLMARVSLEEKERAFLDLSGVSRPINEDYGFVSHCLDDLEIELNKVCQKKTCDTTAYQEACHKSLSYVRDTKFRMMFLRADEFNPSKAAQRMITFFDEKKKLFGVDKLTKRISLDDVYENAEDKLFMESGAMMSPGTDHYGRPIVFGMVRAHPKGYTYETAVSTLFVRMWWRETDYHTDCRRLTYGLPAMRSCWNNISNLFQMRCHFYQLMSIIEDDELGQKLGIVGILYAVGGSEELSAMRQYEFRVHEMRKACPARVAGAHCCFDDSVADYSLPTLLNAVGRYFQSRSRLHYGKRTVFYCRNDPFLLARLTSRRCENLVHYSFLTIGPHVEVRNCGIAIAIGKIIAWNACGL